MSAPPYMRMFWADYHQDTRHLNQREHGAYLLLISEAWRSGGSLPDEDTLLARWSLSTPEAWAKIRPTVMGFFTLSRGRFHHKRVREELAHYADISGKRKTAGKTGGTAKHENNKGNGLANAKQLRLSARASEPESESERKKELTLLLIGGQAASIDFDAWWSLYPRKVGKLKARKAFEKASKVAEVDLTECLKTYAWPADPRFIPHPATWLNDGRWMDATGEHRKRVGFV